ncbi:MAG: hypothetical protein V3U49_04005 [Nitrososphaerales archaeon]
MSEEAESMVKMLADAPGDQRKAMITERFKMIATQPEEQRVKTTAGLLLAISKLDDKKRKEFISTRTEAVAELEPDVRKAIQTARVKAGGQIPEEVNMGDMMMIMQAIQEWPEDKRNMFKETLGGVFKEQGMEMPDFEGMMQKMSNMTEELKKPRWKFW